MERPGCVTTDVQPKPCAHARKIYSFGTFGDFEICEDCGAKIDPPATDLETFLREGLQEREP